MAYEKWGVWGYAPASGALERFEKVFDTEEEAVACLVTRYMESPDARGVAVRLATQGTGGGSREVVHRWNEGRAWWE